MQNLGSIEILISYSGANLRVVVGAQDILRARSKPYDGSISINCFLGGFVTINKKVLLDAVQSQATQWLAGLDLFLAQQAHGKNRLRT